VSDKVIRFRLKRPFPLLPNALAEPYCSIRPELLARTDSFEQVKEAVGSDSLLEGNGFEPSVPGTKEAGFCCGRRNCGDRTG
jgi:hypothetical protein